MKRLALTLSLLLLAAAAQAQMDVPSQGWDGVLNITANTTIDLSQAMTSTWDAQPSGYVAGRGIYDPNKWAVVFHYTSVTIATGATLTFTNHPANPPVVWLVEGAVQVSGTLNIRGQTVTTAMNGESQGGPGGFRGGRHGYAPALPGAGFGPGGGRAAANGYGGGGGYGSAGSGDATTPGGSTYGNVAIVPLIGGSGGGGYYSGGHSGGGGGGAILIGAQTSIAVNGLIDARGGDCSTYGAHGGAGSGGAIRLITPIIQGSGSLNATRGVSVTNGSYNGGAGLTRIEATTQNLGTLTITPSASIVDPGATPLFWPDTATPAIRVVSLNGVAVPADPQALLTYPWQDVYLNGTGNVTALLEATNVQTTATLQVYVTKQGGPRTLLSSGSVTLVGGNTALSTWQAVFTSVPNGMFAIQARAVLP